MASQGSIECAICRKPIPVTLVRISGDGQPVQLQLMDEAPMVDHMRTCGGSLHKALAPVPEPAPSPKVTQRPRLRATPVARARIGQFLEVEGFVSYGGSRACTMCGTRGDACLDELRKEGNRPGCCPACHNGNTHPAPGESLGMCAEFAAEKHGTIR